MRLTTRIAVGAVVAAGVAAGALFGGILRGSGPPQPAPAAPAAAADQALQGFSLGDTESLVAQLQQTLRQYPNDVLSLDLLGLAYQQRARETGDPSYYTKSQGVLDKALVLQPHDLYATSGLGSLALSRHDFGQALQLGLEARAISPTTARNYGVIGDALIELGRYSQAFSAFNEMVSLKPGVASYSRVSYARELRGDITGATAAMRLAEDASRGEGEGQAWTLVQLGKIEWTVGRLDQAASDYRQALRVKPGYVYALDALAQIYGARGDYAKAVALEQQAVDTIPLPQFVTQLGDLYRVDGQEGRAQQQYQLMGAIWRLFTANGVRTDLDQAVYDADHGIHLDQALPLARAGQRARPSIDGDDGLAWALERTGHCQEALGYSTSALRLGTLDATKFFHRGMIERCLGHEEQAKAWFERALKLNPHFSLLWAPVAEEAVA